MPIAWINLLHFYQPPTATNQTVFEATDKSYKRIIRGFKKNPHFKFTFNITGCLLEKLHEMKQHELIDDIKKLVLNGQVELTGSAAYHPILPLLPEKEIIRQIKTNEKILRQHFGNVRLAGFFSPEQAYSSNLASLIKKLGYQWLILDEISTEEKIQPNVLYSDQASGLNICFRSRKYSRDYVPKTIRELTQKNQRKTIVTVTDAELYGLRHHDNRGSFEKIISTREKIETQTISEYLNSLEQKNAIKLRSSSWESTAEELKQNKPYALWQDRDNDIHVLLWNLTNLAIKTIEKFDHDENIDWARHHLNRGLASCTYWWASGKDFRLFSPIAWNPDQIELGIKELLKSVRSLNDRNSISNKLSAETLALKTMKKVWVDHWTKHRNK